MGAFSRSKGARGEREVVALVNDLLGVNAQRRVRQYAGDSDVLGIDGWTVEVKNCAALDLRAWWRQASGAGGDLIPCLFYKVPRKGWRVVWPLSVLLTDQRPHYWTEFEFTADTTPEAWAAVVRELKG